ncbi:MAG: sulfotransferase [Rhodospirillales bacterium 20-60-12]|nr:MAG: sulfotransferase [Rhodospirillales bacterium 20-60-12]
MDKSAGFLMTIDKTICPCGSGLRRVRCCGLETAGLPDPDLLGPLDALAEEARLAHGSGKMREAERHLLKLLDLAPNHRNGLRLLFEIRRAEGRNQAAETLVRRLAALPPMQAAAQLLWAQLLIGLGRHAEAQGPASQALRLAPKDANAHHVMAVIFTETKRLIAGERHYREAMRLLDRDDGTVLGNLAWNLKLQGRLDEAAALYDQALALRTDNARGLCGAAQVMAARGNLPAAIALVDKAVAMAPDDRTVGLLRGLMDLRAGQPQGLLDRLEATAQKLAPNPLSPSEAAARGWALDRLGRHDEAFAAYQAARGFQRDRMGLRFDPSATEARLNRLRGFFTADRLGLLPRAALPAFQPAPIFILGVPRSGSSLLEQILTRIPGIEPLDDRGPLPDLVKIAPKLVEGMGGTETAYPEALGETLIGEARDIPTMLAGRYVAAIRALGVAGPETKYVTDRNPENLWHMGLIGLMFPNAPIIHVLRHPLDVVLSGFAQDRLYDGRAGVSLISLARLYDMQMSMIRHYRGQMTLRYLPVRYEDLVENPVSTLARLFASLNINGDPTPLVNAPERMPLRATSHQILHERLHGRSLYRHRHHMAALEEIMPVLQPWIDELGYHQAQVQAA